MPVARHTHSGMADDGPKLPIDSIEGLTALLGAKTAFDLDSRTTGEGTGPQTITVGFKPKIVIIHAVHAATSGGVSFGSMDKDASKCTLTFENGGAPQRTFDATKIINVKNNNGVAESRAQFAEFTNTGFKLDWVEVGVNVEFLWIVIG